MEINRSFGHAAPTASTGQTSSAADNKLANFMVTPYKLYLSVVIECFLSNKTKYTQTQIGQFSRLIMKLIHSLDTSFVEVKNCIENDLKFDKLTADVSKKLEEVITKDVEGLMTLMSTLKSCPNVHKSSLLGLFIRKMFLFFDKLTFTSAAGLYNDFKKYVNISGDDSVHQDDADNSGNDGADVYNRNLWRKCPKQVDYFFSKQVKLMQINEKMALDPLKLGAMISAASKDMESVCGVNSSASNSLNFVRFLNNLRVREFNGAIESLKTYFDLQGSTNNKCWSSFNLALTYYTFGHLSLAVECIKECISSSQEFNDDKCLEFVLLLFVKILIDKNNHHFDPSRLLDADQDADSKSSFGLKDANESIKEVVPLLIHLQTKSNLINLPIISSLASLHLEQIIGHPCKYFNDVHNSCNNNSYQPTPSSTFYYPTNCEVVCIKNSLNSVLMMVYGNKSGHFAKLGVHSLSVVTSQLLLHLYSVDAVGRQLVHHVNESTALGMRYLAVNVWKRRGMYQKSLQILNFCSELFSDFNSNINKIWKRSLHEICFEKCLFTNNYREAKNEADAINLFDKNEAKLRQIELLTKMKSVDQAYNQLIDLSDKESASATDYFKIRINLLKARIIEDMNQTLKCVEDAQNGRFFGLKCKSLILLSNQLINLGLITQSLLIMKKCYLFIIADGDLSDNGSASSVFADAYFKLASTSDGRKDKDRYMRLSMSYNERAIKCYQLIDDVDNVLKCLKVGANIFNELQMIEERNLYSKKFRILFNSLNNN